MLVPPCIRAGLSCVYSLLLVLGCFFPVHVVAGMGSIASNYGITPEDLASTQALSLFQGQVSAIHYNPAVLVRESGGELMIGAMHAGHNLRAVNAGDGGLQRDGDVLNNDPTQQLLIGVKSDMSRMSRSEHPLYFGVMLGIERFGSEMMSFSAETREEGQFLRYGRQPMFLSLGGGTQLWRGISAGWGIRVTLQSDAKLQAQTNLSGQTRQEKFNVTSRPQHRPVLGLSMAWGETFCQYRACWLNGLETALVWRDANWTATRTKANTTVPGIIAPPGLGFGISALDGFQPETLHLGAAWRYGALRLGMALEWQRWSLLTEKMAGDDIRNQAELSFRNLLVPRIGIEATLSPSMRLLAGISHERSPLRGEQSLDVNGFDNDRWLLGAGLTFEPSRSGYFKYSPRLSLGYQYQQLQGRSFSLSQGNPGSEPYDRVRASGNVHVFAASVGFGF